MNESTAPPRTTPSPASTSGPYRVDLEAYAGPLDLLLYLVKRSEIDLNDIPVAQLTEQYLQHLALIQAMDKQLDIETAGEFLVMAATLLEIKSQLLVPLAERQSKEQRKDDQAPDEEPGEAVPETDPRYELVQQLLAYKRYKDAAIDLEHRQEDWSKRYAAHPVARGKAEPTIDEDAIAEQRDLEIEDADVMHLCEAFARLLDSVGQAKPTHDVTYDETPISLHAEDIHDRLTREGSMTLQQIFIGRSNRSEMIGLFLAMLELVRQYRVAVTQDRSANTIALEARTPPPVTDLDAATDWTNPETGEIDYAWPDEKSRKRAERRDRLRKQREAEGKSPDVDDDAELDDDSNDDPDDES